MSSQFTTQGMMSWSELTTSQPAEAVEFYGALLGWQFDTMPMPDGDYHVASADGEKVAGIMAMPQPANNAPPFWGQYVTVTDIEETATKVQNLGGTVLVPITDIPQVGRFILFQDPQGATLSAIQYHPSEA